MRTFETIKIRCSAGTGLDQVGFEINKLDGKILKITLDVEAFGSSLPWQFDVLEYRNHYQHVDEFIDILDIGYHTAVGVYIKPDPDFRMGIMREWFFYAAQHLTEVTGGLERFVEINTRQVPRLLPDYQPVCTAAREFLRGVHYQEPDDDEDKARLPDGVILGESNEGPCDGCGELIKLGYKMLMVPADGLVYCTRECFDKHGAK